jgi:hypothetical protein
LVLVALVVSVLEALQEVLWEALHQVVVLVVLSMRSALHCNRQWAM